MGMMKTKLVLMLFVSSLLLVFGRKTSDVVCSQVQTDDKPDPVLDVSGNPLQPHTEYYISNIYWGAGAGGLSLASIKNTCPLSVVRINSIFTNGLPWSFSPVTHTEGVVRESTNLNIKTSSENKLCSDYSSVWKIDDYDESTGQTFVTTGGIEGNPGGIYSIKSWFKIEKSDWSYKIVYCPGDHDLGNIICKDVGIFIDNGFARLALSDQPHPVVFVKA